MNHMRNLITIVESGIKTIKHGSEDDIALSDDLNRIYGYTQRPGRSLTKLGHLVTLDVWVESPEHPRYFFLLDQAGTPKGFCLLKQSSRTKGIDAYRVNLIFLVTDARGHGDGFAFYEFLLDRGFTLESDTDQTTMSQGVWAKLSKRPGYRVDVVGEDGEIIPGAKISTVYASSGHLIARKT